MDTPFRAIIVDRVTEGPTTIFWDLKDTFRDPGPYRFRVQRSHTGNPFADDWTDIGPEVVNQFYYLDNAKTDVAIAITTHYRVIINSGLSRFISGPVSALQWTDRNQWRIIKEMYRRNRKALIRSPYRREGYLLFRRRFGPDCPRCINADTGEIADANCLSCFAPNTMIRTETGFRPIASIEVGDKVLTSDGTYQAVTRKFEQPHKGKACRILTSSTTSPIIVTPEHPLRSLVSSHSFVDTEKSARHGFSVCGPTPCDNFMRAMQAALYRETGATFHKKSGKWRAKVQVGGVRGGGALTLGYFDTKELAQQEVFAYRKTHFDLLHKLDWVEARDLDARQWIDTVYPTVEEDMETVAVPVLPEKGRRKVLASRRGATSFLVDSEFLWMVGMYIAEGSSGSRSINFSLHVKEVEYQDRLMNFFRSYGFKPKIDYREDSNGVSVRVSSTALAAWFPNWLGSKCDNKRIPEELMRLPASKIAHIVQGIWDGDGTKDTNEIGQTSEVLSLQLIELLHRLGNQPTVYRMTDRPGRKPAWMTSWEEPTLTHKNRKGRWHFDSRLLTRIRKNEEIDYDGLVYNLEVEGSHTYVVQNLVVHNCYGTGKLGGYYQALPYQFAIVSPRVITERVKSGVATSADDFRTGTFLGYPLIHTYDVFADAHSDERFVIGTIRQAETIGAVPVVQTCEMTTADFSNIIYKFPLPNRQKPY